MENQEENLTETLQEEKNQTGPLKSKKVLVLVILVIGLGVLTGYFLAKRQVKEGVIEGGEIINEGKIKPGSEFGSKNQSFKDTTIGVLEKGGIDGEGTHKLIREGGPSQTAYLTSSVLDLDQFVGRKVQVWGETFKGQKAGWLMDVGRLKILE